MPFPMTDDLLNFDVYPRVFTVGKESEIHVRQLGMRPVFEPGETYRLVVCALDGGNPAEFPATGDYEAEEVTADEEGNFTFTHTFASEQQYFLRFEKRSGERVKQFPVYAVSSDLAGRLPLLGDLHMHTCRSDGNQLPAVVAANYRAHGYDFTVISDHCRYYPSLEAIEAYRDVPHDLAIIPGEEVHMPAVHGKRGAVHIVNFGGAYSINALTEGEAVSEKGADPQYRSLDGVCPPSMPLSDYEDAIEALAASLEIPEGVDAIPAAICKWVFTQIRKAGGLGIFAHPNWIADTFHVPEKFTDYLMKERDFDAFEVLGGENYYEQNGFQTHRYYDEIAKGNKIPIVGSTDSHSSNLSNRNALICSTVIFAKENERKALINAVKSGYSVAVDTISTEFRLVGETRLARYACFLLKNYFPLHDALCAEEGRLMKTYVTGLPCEREEAAETLKIMSGRVARLQKKLFDF